ncbi:MAG: type II toxin-antitoxin system VapC family toxin [Spirochaetales bacterium]|nr:type II toxin-antitoxin system VapC family toxin [Spirochaetales bacterium]
MYLLDTNICIYTIKRKHDSLLKRIHNNLEKKIFISTLSVAELEFGVSNSNYPEKNRIALLEFLAIFDLLQFDDKDAIVYGKIKTKLRKKGNIIGPIDLLLAAQAVSKNLIFVTNNIKEFQRIDNLCIEDWSV